MTFHITIKILQQKQFPDRNFICLFVHHHSRHRFSTCENMLSIVCKIKRRDYKLLVNNNVMEPSQE